MPFRYWVKLLRFFLLVYCCQISPRAFSFQEPTPRILKRLIGHAETIPIITGGARQIVPAGLLPAYVRNEFQMLVKTRDHLYCNVNGSGSLFALTDSGGKLHCRRVDSTHYSGNSFNALNFADGNTIYSLGGYGFWRTNGLLRRFNPYTAEWDLVKLDKEVPFTAGYISSYDTASKWLYVSSQPFFQDGFRNDSSAFEQHRNSLYRLDLQSGKWFYEGKLDHANKGVQVPCKWGILSLYGPDSALMLSFRENAVLRLEPALIHQLNKVFTPKGASIYYCIDTTFYFGNLKDDLFDSIRLSEAQFISTEIPLVAGGASRTNFVGLRWWLLLLPLLFTGVVFYFRRKARSGPQAAPMGGAAGFDRMASPDDGVMVFNTIELELIKLLFEKALAESDANQEEVNKLLGVSTKKLSVQKKNRNDIINGVNQKWQILNQVDQPLVERKRSAEDMRVYIYGIDRRWLPELAKLMDVQSPDV